jgi:hypothetical protein
MSPGSPSIAPQAEMENAAVCLFFLTDILTLTLTLTLSPTPTPTLTPTPIPNQVCLFCLTDNIFHDERSIALFARAVKLGKQCELIV